MTLAELHDWTVECQDAPDTRLRQVAAEVLRLLRERPDLVTTEYQTLREDLRRLRYDNASLLKEVARLRGLVNAQNPAPWERE
ncbi:hypothetical protein J8F10_16615 [Gemmata sp. G18]|uniref:Uncharacterized protein n=1 Tax=Gemmata palustris TaxID=2822762 RepID=A0ABS5BT39_9BACT|nr:hypothetical protein [Gemmata palustris]MBP3956896.1 hypothetical protein [Gemmata palustris]